MTSIRHRRREIGLSQVELSAQSGVALGTIQRLEHHPEQFEATRLGTLRKLARGLEWSLRDLLAGRLD